MVPTAARKPPEETATTDRHCGFRRLRRADIFKGGNPLFKTPDPLLPIVQVQLHFGGHFGQRLRQVMQAFGGLIEPLLGPLPPGSAFAGSGLKFGENRP
jgi:hypothetical protein